MIKLAQKKIEEDIELLKELERRGVSQEVQEMVRSNIRNLEKIEVIQTCLINTRYIRGPG